MQAVSIDYGKCNGCAICVQASARCFLKDGGQVRVLADDKICMLCGHCVGACPTGAIEHHLMDMSNFPPVAEEAFVTTDKFVRFIRERRAHRAFLQRQVSKEDLEKLVDAVRYAPTGHNDQTVEIIMVRNPERRKELSDLAIDSMAEGLKKDVEKLEAMKASGTASSEQIGLFQGWVDFQQTIVNGGKAGQDPVFYEAPAVAIFHSTRKTVTAKDNGIIAATTMGLVARTLGLETTYIWMFENAANSYPPLREALALPKDNLVVAVLVIGYPKIKYLRAVDRKPIRIRWE